MTTKRFISRTEFAEAIGVSEPTVDRMIAEGRVAATRSAGKGSRYLILASELDRLEAEAQQNLVRPDHDDDVLRVLPNGTKVDTGVLPMQFPEDETEPLPGGGYIVPGSVPVQFPEG